MTATARQQGRPPSGRDADSSSASTRPRWDTIVEVVTVVSATLVVLIGVHPGNLLVDAIPLGTDLSGHAAIVWNDRATPSVLLPGGWSDISFLGFPINQLYPPLPSALAALLSFVVPLNVALKLVTVAPLVLLPAALWAMARMSGAVRLVSAGVSVAAIPFVFDTSCDVCGGNLASTFTGEFANAWGILFAVLAVGASDLTLRTGRRRWLPPVLIALTAFSHPVSTVWLVLLVSVVAIVHLRAWWPDRRRQVLLVAASTVALCLWWWLPFLARRDWMPAMGFPKAGPATDWLFPASPWWELVVVALLVAGGVAAVRRRTASFIALGAGALIAAAAFVVLPESSQLFNLRVVPYWDLGVWVLALVGLGYLVELTLARAGSRSGAAPRLVPVGALLVAFGVVGTTWGWWGVTQQPVLPSTAGRGLLGVDVTPVSRSASFWGAGVAGVGSEADLDDVTSLLRGTASSDGCGRVAWNRGSADGPGEPFFDADFLWQAPVWTDGCLTATTGVLYDSSATAPASAAALSLVSDGATHSIGAFPEPDPNLATGVSWLQFLGIRYYVTHGADAAAAAAKAPGLQRLESRGSWSMWRVQDSDVVSDLAYQPVVVSPTVSDAEFIDVAKKYESSAGFTRGMLLQEGPSDWPTVAPFAEPPPIPLDRKAGVSGVRATESSVSFSVANPGIPVLVKVSDFPGWNVTDGQAAVYRSTPNLLVVVPSTTTVTLTKQRTAIDLAAIVLGLVGAILVVAIAVIDRRRQREVRATES